MNKNLFKQLENFYKNFDKKIKKLGLEQKKCGDCGRCCTSPPFLMTTSDLEYEYLVRYLKNANYHINFHFEVIDDNHPDKRYNLSAWTCPLYKPSVGCVGHPARPFSCRILGPLAQEGVKIPECVFKQPLIYETPLEIPLWEEYAAILRSYPFKKGYISFGYDNS